MLLRGQILLLAGLVYIQRDTQIYTSVTVGIVEVRASGTAEVAYCMRKSIPLQSKPYKLLSVLYLAALVTCKVWEQIESVGAWN